MSGQEPYTLSFAQKSFERNSRGGELAQCQYTGGSQPSLTLVPGGALFQPLSEPGMHMVHRHTCRKKHLYT